ncbi:MAG: V-type ATP synthase subunit A [Candidatus Coatesbacteria bacterium]|nr:V-type ATP synthase subunit A [Candidatus Coatesbacteria bacterium]
MEDSIRILRINGPIIWSYGDTPLKIGEQVFVGNLQLIAEVIGIEADHTIIQVYEDTIELKPGEPVYPTGLPLSIELAPGLISSIFDGIGRPLDYLATKEGDFLKRGTHSEGLDREKKWEFTPSVKKGDLISGGEIIGNVKETSLFNHRILLPPSISGRVVSVREHDEYTIEDEILQIETSKGTESVSMLQKWPVRTSRPFIKRLQNKKMLFTGQRVLDFLFPIPKGGVAAIPGGFGTGKTVTQHQLAKWSDADIIIYVGCGERGNEMTQVLTEFPELVDPVTERPLMERTILIANTSNMPVTARESSIYTGITLAEYFRDQGYDVAVMADSTSRWAEALREISGRLEEMPAEQGYPAYLGSRLAEFYERAGSVLALSHREGSVSIIGAVSPAGSDFSEPVTQNTKRFIGAFWALSKELASARHFPAISWTDSYSEYIENVKPWWDQFGNDKWSSFRNRMMYLLTEDQRLQQIIKIIGADSLPDDQRLILETAKLIKQGFLQQSAINPNDAYSSIEKQMSLAELILYYYDESRELLKKGIPVIRIWALPITTEILRIKDKTPKGEEHFISELKSRINKEFSELKTRY